MTLNGLFLGFNISTVSEKADDLNKSSLFLRSGVCAFFEKLRYNVESTSIAHTFLFVENSS